MNSLVCQKQESSAAILCLSLASTVCIEVQQYQKALHLPPAKLIPAVSLRCQRLTFLPN